MAFKLTPGEMERRLASIESHFVLLLKKQNLFLKFLLLILVVILSWSFLLGKLLPSYKLLYYSNFVLSFKTLLLISFLSFFLRFIPSLKARIGWTIFSFLFCAFFDFYYSHWPSLSHNEGNWALGLIFAQLFLGGAALFLNGKIKKSGILWCYVLASIGLWCLGGYVGASSGWYYYRQPLLFSAFVVAMILENTNLASGKKLQLLFNPSHLFLSVNYPIDSYLFEENADSWEIGLVQIGKSMTALYVTYLLSSWFGSPDLFGQGVRNYLMYLAVVIAVGNMVTGLSNLYYINVPVCSNFAFLSRSPLDFLKRENAHAYSFSLRFFYFNFLKFFKNPLFVVFGYFLVFPFYRNILIFFSKKEAFSWEGLGSVLLWGYAFWALLLLAIVIYPEKMLKKYVSNEWWHVALNHIVMFLVFFFHNYFASSLLPK